MCFRAVVGPCCHREGEGLNCLAAAVTEKNEGNARINTVFARGVGGDGLKFLGPLNVPQPLLGKELSQRNRSAARAGGREMCGKAPAERGSPAGESIKSEQNSSFLPLPSHPFKCGLIRKESCGIRWERPRRTCGEPFP